MESKINTLKRVGLITAAFAAGGAVRAEGARAQTPTETPGVVDGNFAESSDGDFQPMGIDGGFDTPMDGNFSESGFYGDANFAMGAYDCCFDVPSDLEAQDVPFYGPGAEPTGKFCAPEPGRRIVNTRTGKSEITLFYPQNC